MTEIRVSFSLLFQFCLHILRGQEKMITLTYPNETDAVCHAHKYTKVHKRQSPGTPWACK